RLAGVGGAVGQGGGGGGAGRGVILFGGSLGAPGRRRCCSGGDPPASPTWDTTWPDMRVADVARCPPFVRFRESSTHQLTGAHQPRRSAPRAAASPLAARAQ